MEEYYNDWDAFERWQSWYDGRLPEDYESEENNDE